MTTLMLSVPYLFAKSRPWRWDLFFIALVVAATIAGFLFFLANKKDGQESHAFVYLLVSFGVACAIWLGTLFVLIANYGL